MSKFFKIAAIVFTIALMGVSCTPISEKIAINGCDIEGLESVSLGAGQLNLGTELIVDASNSSALDVSLADFGAEIFSRSGKRVGTVTYVPEKGQKNPTLPRRSEALVHIPLKVSFDNPLSALSLASMTFGDYGDKGYTVSYNCKLKAGLVSKRFKADKVPIADLAKAFDR